MFAKITLVTVKKNNAVKTWSSGLVSRPEGMYLYTVDRENTATLKAVSLGINADGVAEILSGISPGDTVVVAGQTLLSDGSKVNILKQIDPPTSADETAVAVKTVKPVLGEMVSAIKTNGTVVSRTAVSVTPDAAGRLVSLYVKLVTGWRKAR